MKSQYRPSFDSMSYWIIAILGFQHNSHSRSVFSIHKENTKGSPLRSSSSGFAFVMYWDHHCLHALCIWMLAAIKDGNSDIYKTCWQCIFNKGSITCKRNIWAQLKLYYICMFTHDTLLLRYVTVFLRCWWISKVTIATIIYLFQTLNILILLLIKWLL